MHLSIRHSRVKLLRATSCGMTTFSSGIQEIRNVETIRLWSSLSKLLHHWTTPHAGKTRLLGRWENEVASFDITTCISETEEIMRAVSSEGTSSILAPTLSLMFLVRTVMCCVSEREREK